MCAALAAFGSGRCFAPFVTATPCRVVLSAVPIRLSFQRALIHSTRALVDTTQTFFCRGQRLHDCWFRYVLFYRRAAWVVALLAWRPSWKHFMVVGPDSMLPYGLLFLLCCFPHLEREALLQVIIRYRMSNAWVHDGQSGIGGTLSR